MGFCKRCYTKFMLDFRKKYPDPKISPNTDELVFKCQVPLFDHNGYGELVVRIWDCKNNRYNDYTQADYLQKKSEGLLP